MAAVIKADRKTVESVRQRLESTGEIPRLSTTCGKDGKSRPRRIKKQTPVGTTTTDLAPSSNPEEVIPDALGLDSDQTTVATVQEPRESAVQVDDGSVEPRAKNRLCAIGSALEHLGVEMRSAREEGTWTRTQLLGFMNQLREETAKLKVMIGT